MEPEPPAVEARSLNHWTAREVSWLSFETSSFGEDEKVVCRGGGAEGRDLKTPPQEHELDASRTDLCPLSGVCSVER